MVFGEISKELVQLNEKYDEDFSFSPIRYKSIPTPQYVFYCPDFGSEDEGEEVRDMLQLILNGLSSQHAEFVRFATLTPTGKTCNSSNFSASHSLGLYEYAKTFCSK